MIYTGKAYNPDGIKINIKKIVEDWLWNDMPDFRDFDGVVVPHPDACMVFELYEAEGALLETYMVFLCYEELDIPSLAYRGINGHADPRQKIFISALSEPSVKPITGNTLSVEDNQLRAIFVSNRDSWDGDSQADLTIGSLLRRGSSATYYSGITDSTYHSIGGKYAEYWKGGTRYCEDWVTKERVYGYLKKYQNMPFYPYINGDGLLDVVKPFLVRSTFDVLGKFDDSIYGFFKGLSNAWGECWQCVAPLYSVLVIVLPRSLRKIDPDILNIQTDLQCGLYDPGHPIGPARPFVYYSGNINEWRNVEGGNEFALWARGQKVYCMNGVYEAEV